jgi:Lrp/AsnC family leucine-responsive transcriptional regulator
MSATLAFAPASTRCKPASLDAIDHRLVRALLADGRRPLRELATLTGLSTSAVHARVRRLSELGVIRGYRAVVDHHALGMAITALLTMTVDSGDEADLVERIAACPDVEHWHRTAGERHYLAVVHAAGPDELDELIRALTDRLAVTAHATLLVH